MRNIRKILLAILVMVSMVNLSWAASWTKVGLGIDDPTVLKITINPQDSSAIFAATRNVLYKSLDHGQHYKAVFQVPGEANINHIYIDNKKPRNIYLATSVGLYSTVDDGNHWQRIYYSSDEQSRRCLSLIRSVDTLYLGTGKGLLYKNISDTNWSSVGNELSRKPVFNIVSGGHFLYFSTDDSLYDLDLRTNSYSKVFTAGNSQASADEADEAIFEDEASMRQLIRFLAVTEDDDNAIYIATTRGIYLSGDEGEHWRLLANPPIDLETLNAVLVLGEEEDRKLLVGTRQGAFWFEDGQWTPVYQGMETNVVNDLAKDNGNAVYAATGSGVFRLSEGYEGTSIPDDFLRKVQDKEPTIQQVHKWAVDYAEVNPQKIKSWRSLARTKAFLPDLSVGVDRADSELFHWDTGTNPDTLLKGRDSASWDVSLSWDLGDLVWSTDQTTIDSRSKLMVELREDILDQVTRLYFERRRLQAELSAQDQASDFKASLDKQLRVEELTALLDAFTGGKFSNFK